jgi:bacterioferritin-associated ferredoxin
MSQLARTIVLASQYTVVDPARMWRAMHAHRDALTRLGARHVAGYQSVSNRHEMLMTIAGRTSQPIPDVLATPAVMQWFDIAGVTDIPPIFVGALRDTVSFAAREPMASPVIVSATAPVDDAAALIAEIRCTANAFTAVGIRTHVYDSVDRPNEVMVFHELNDERQARRLVELPQTALRWAARAGLRVSPAVRWHGDGLIRGWTARTAGLMYVCLCSGATVQQVVDASAAGANTSRQVAAACGAGDQCGRCRRTVRAILADVSSAAEGPHHCGH